MPKPRVLVIDDDPMITELLKEHLSCEGCDVETVHLAEQGYTKATQFPPDLILLDVMLPDATGYQMVGRFRENPTTKSVPIIMMTGSARTQNQQKIAKDMGADDYVLKPFDVIQVGLRVQKLIKNHDDEKPKATFSIEIPHQDAPTVWDPPTAEPMTPLPLPLSPDLEPVKPIPEQPDPEPIIPPSSPPIAADTVSNTPTVDVPAESLHKQFAWGLTPGIFMLHLIITLAGTQGGVLRAATFVAGGWALLLGLMVTICAILRITLDTRDAFRVLGWAAIPMVMRAMASLVGFSFSASRLPSPVFWLRPLDIFEGTAMVILGICFRKLPGSSLSKSILGAVLMALAWCLTARGYFRPF
jgi:CheY-like chemotaxis protein